MTRLRRTAFAAALLAAGATLATAPAGAQATGPADDPARRSGFDALTGVVSPVFQRWTFADPIVQDSGRVASVSQIALPFNLRFPIGGRWTGDVSGAVSRSTVDVGSSEWELAGLSDVRVRAIGRLKGENLLLTLGANLPTGKVGLDAQEFSALQIVGAPSLGMAVPIFGGGLGGTVGLVAAGQGVGGWAYAFGASFEQRSRFTAAELTIAGARTPTDVRPGQALHLSLGADGLLAGGRLSLFAIGDVFSDDQIRLRTTPFTFEESSYQLGPALTTGARYEFPTTRLRSLNASVTNRYRTKYKDATGTAVDGSSGNALEATVGAVTGAVGRPGVVLGLRGRFDTGIASDDRLVTAASSLWRSTPSVGCGR